ncbi:MAG: type II secretion system protein [Sarcina sp.]
MVRSKKKKGFTLIELVIVLAVLAIIALIAIPNFTKVRNDSLVKADQRSMEQIEKITLMAIANEDIVGAGTIVITDGKNFTPVSSSDAMFNQVTGGRGSYGKLIQEIEGTQSAGAKTFKVEITGSELKVKVTTDSK